MTQTAVGRTDRTVPASEQVSAQRTSEVVWRFRLVAVSLALAAVAFVQRPGQLVGDTKLDLAIAPGEFLQRALHLWDPEGAFGQVQNQAYGYLFPMGPFFWAGNGLDVPGWVVQRLWWSLVMVVAFLGVVKLCGALGIGTQVGRVIAGVAFALSPRLLTTLGPISIEAWPSALAPWVLVPLVIGASRGSTKRAAALSAAAIALVGGVNAAATAAVLPLGILWLLTREPGPRRRSLMTWWPVLTFFGTCWWLVPLLLLGRYSPPFLDFIESASVTTAPTTLFDAFRGTSHWVPYVEPAWQAGNSLLTTGYLILNGGVVLALGLVGLARRDAPERQFLMLGILTGLLLVTFGHVGSVQGWFAETQRLWLDGALAPFRNVHKYDVVIRLPLVLGLAHLLATARPRERVATPREAPARYVGLVLLSLVAVVGAAGPAFVGRLAPTGDFQAIPGYWQETSSWLARNDDGTRALLVPGSSFGTYVWGDPRDEPMQPLADSPWAVRNAVPLAPPGNIRMLDAVEERLVEGRGSTGLAAYLRRAGIGYLVVRNDLKRSADVPDPVLVHQALQRSPGITRAAAFGPDIGAEARLDQGRGRRVVVDQSWQTRYPAVEIYKVWGAREAVVSTRNPVVIGGPESLLALSDHGVLTSEPTVLAVDAPRNIGSAPLVLTDGLRHRERSFGRVHDGLSATLAPGEGVKPDAPAREYALDETGRWETQARLLGVEALTASSSMSDADAHGPVRPDRSPYAAFDRDPHTQWTSDAVDRGQPWLEMTLSTSRRPGAVVLTAGDALGDGTQPVRIRTDAGVTRVVELRPGESSRVTLPIGPTRHIRVVGAYPMPGQRLALAEVLVPGVKVARPLVTPTLPRKWGAPDVVLLSAEGGFRSGCVEIALDHRCAPHRDRAGEESSGLDRLVSLPQPARYRPEVTTRPRPGPALLRLVQQDQPINVTASSSSVAAPLGSALAAVDGDAGTTWVADADDARPSLSLNWLGKATIRGLRVQLDRDAAATVPRTATVTYPGGRQSVRLDASGRARLRPIRTDQLQVSLTGAEQAQSLQYDGSATALGVGISELGLRGLRLLPMRLSAEPRSYGCGSGPQLVLNGRRLATAVTSSPRGLLYGDTAQARLCAGRGTVEVPEGQNRLRLVGGDAFEGTALLLRRPGAWPTAPVREVSVTQDSPAELDATLPEGAGPGVLVLHQNVNRGWEARAEGATLAPVTVDGWQQAWRLPPGPDRVVEVSYEPDEWYRTGLAAGGVLLLGLFVLCLLPQRVRARRAPAVRARRIAPVAMVVLAGTAAGLLAGWPGVGVMLAGSLAVALARTRVGAEEVAWLAAVPVVLAAGLYWLRPVGDPDGWAGNLAVTQYLVVLALGAAVQPDLAGLTRRFFSRMKGSSTTR